MSWSLWFVLFVIGLGVSNLVAIRLRKWLDMIPGFEVCRFRDLVKGQQFLDPRTGDLVRADEVVRKPQRSGPVQITISVSGGSPRAVLPPLTLRHDRPIRRKL